jgi:hypothetical protein
VLVARKVIRGARLVREGIALYSLGGELRADMIEIAQAAHAAVETIDTRHHRSSRHLSGQDVGERVDRMFQSLAKKIDDLGRSGGVVYLPNPIARRVELITPFWAAPNHLA